MALPALVKVLELSRPYACTGTILLLMLLYTLLLVFLMLYVNIRRGRAAGIVAALGLSLYGFLLNPELIKQLFNLPDELMYRRTGGGVALAAQPRDVPHAQLRL